MIIETPSRLHVTLIDLNGKYGRIDGGVGITLQKPKLSLEAESGYGDIQVSFSKSQSSTLNKESIDDYNAKIISAAHKITEFLKLKNEYHFKVKDIYPSHSGLGSGTQLSLAVAKLITQMNGRDLSDVEIAEIMGRGGTSGIGVVSFNQGGFIVDGGHKTSLKPGFLPSSASKAPPPPIIARYDFPEDWKIVMVIPKVERKVFGDGEVNIFQEYCPIPLLEVQKLAHILLMKMMPAVLEKDLDEFGSAVNIIQNIGFKKIELKLQNPFIKDLMDNLRSAGASGVGMSSFGPTVYAVTDTNVKEICRTAHHQMMDKEGEIILTHPQNNGAIIK